MGVWDLNSSLYACEPSPNPTLANVLGRSKEKWVPSDVYRTNVREWALDHTEGLYEVAHRHSLPECPGRILSWVFLSSAIAATIHRPFSCFKEVISIRWFEIKEKHSIPRPEF